MKKTASAHWQGSIKEGTGHISTQSGALDKTPYGFKTRFSDKPGSNPEELLGAAHAACFSMALSKELGDLGLTAESIDTSAEVTLDKQADGFAITAVHLILRAAIPGADQERFEQAALAAKAGCPLSKVINASISLDAQLL
jgi:osmotically inducible protein OsmC